MQQPGWVTVALGTACGFLLGVVLVVALTGSPEPEIRTRARTVTVASTTTTPGSVIVSTVVPDVVGERLDVAKLRLGRARFDPDVDGGGVLGVIIDSNWQVVAQDPAAGSPLEQGSSVAIRIERR